MKLTIPDPRSCCPVASSLDIIGDRWTLLVIRDLFLGKQRFDEFLKSPEGIATNILSQRLRWLAENGLVDRAKDPADGRKVIYQLTARGKRLQHILVAMIDWGMETIDGVSVHPDAQQRLKKKR